MAPPFDVKRTGNDQGGSVPGVHTFRANSLHPVNTREPGVELQRDYFTHTNLDRGNTRVSQAAPRDSEDETSCGRDRNHSYPDFPTSGLGFSDL